MPLSADSVSRLTKEQALDILPDVIIGLLQHHLKAAVYNRGPGPKNRQVVFTGRGVSLTLHIDDWHLISDNITYDPETKATLGAPDQNSPPPPNALEPFRLGSLLTVKGETPANRRYNPRTSINRQLLLRNDVSFKAYIIERLREIF